MNLFFRYIITTVFIVIHIPKIQSQEINGSIYGNNESVGQYAKINGIEMYYEEYGEGDPLFLIHGNGASINSMKNQIEYFKNKYRVIVADSRGHGKSGLKTDSLTYKQMASDWIKLINYLKLDSINVIGWSDGGIIGLLISIKSNKVDKLVTMGANLCPDTTAVQPWAIDKLKNVRSMVLKKIKDKDQTRNWKLLKMQIDLLFFQPHISKKELSQIESSVLVMSGDRDIIKVEHSVEIYQHIKNSQLCIIPGGTHSAPVTNPKEFNETVDIFLSEPYQKNFKSENN